MERELERFISEREELSRELANIQRRQKLQPSTELASEEDTLAANLNYIQENITQVQHSIMELEDGKETVNESQTLHSMIEDVQTVEEAKFLIEKLSNSAILATCDIALTNNRLTEREAMYTEVCRLNDDATLNTNKVCLKILIFKGATRTSNATTASHACFITKSKCKHFGHISATLTIPNE